MFSSTMKKRASLLSRLTPWMGLIASGVVLVGVSVSANAATYYLDPNGNDTTGTGSSASPWKTLYKAAQVVPANQGHIIHLKAGTYTLDATLNAYGTRAAVWVNPGIFVEGENTATDKTKTVILVHQNDSFPGFAINVSTGNYETSPGGIRNLTIDGDNYVGAGGVSTLKISNYTVDNCTFKNLSGNALRLAVSGDGTHPGDISGLEVKNSSFSKTKGPCINGDGWLNSSIHDNFMDNSDTPGATLSNPSPWGDCVRLNYVGSTRIHHNTMYAPSYVSQFTSWQQQSTQDTICLFYASGGNEVDNNVLSQWTSFVASTSLNGYDKILKFHDNYVYFPSDVAGSGIELMFNDSDVYNNYFDNCEIGVLTDPGAVSAGNTASDVNNVRVFNNVFRRTFSGATYEGYGVAFRNSTNTTANNWSIYSNVFDGFDRGFQLDGGGFIKNLNVKNNVFLNCGRIINWGYPTDPITNSNFTNNVWHYTLGFDLNPAPPASSNVVFANNKPGATTGLGMASDSGLKLTGGLPSPYYTPLNSSAITVDAGTASIAPGITLTGFSGNAPDIGRYEWSGAASNNTPPTVATAASANPNPVTTGTTANLSALGADNGGEPSLTYTWATTGTPPAGVSFSTNGSNAAKNTTVTFSKAGSYNLQVTISDAGGLSVTSSVTVTVQQSATTVAVTPATANVSTSGTQQFAATVKDQFGNAVSGASITWSVSAGSGSINASGLYTAPATAGTATVKAVSGSLNGTATVTITAPQPPAAPTNLAATAGNAQVSLTWTAVSGATSYNVKRATVSGGPYTTVQSGVSATNYTDTGLTNGTTYYYVVTAQNANGTSGNSNQASATPFVPAAVTRYEAEAGTISGATVSTSRAGYSGTGFIQVGFLGGTTWSNVTPPAAGTRTLTVRYATTNVGTRTLTLWVNGVAVKQLSFANSSGNWATLTDTITLNAGTNTVAIKGGYGDSAGLDLDYIDVQ